MIINNHQSKSLMIVVREELHVLLRLSDSPKAGILDELPQLVLQDLGCLICLAPGECAWNGHGVIDFVHAN
jgi:hypothetical protein